MRKISGFFLTILMVAGVTTICSAADNSKKEAIAIQAATNWVQLVDNGKYGESWNAAAAIFKKTISRDKWQQALK